ncbi:MAG: hypothetical protein D6725_12250 [Planctomycetota bacterium]|nr:MAG: hypothetical protein D6725_12250 [Planctomycetota bacterium]
MGADRVGRRKNAAARPWFRALSHSVSRRSGFAKSASCVVQFEDRRYRNAAEPFAQAAWRAPGRRSEPAVAVWCGPIGHSAAVPGGR